MTCDDARERFSALIDERLSRDERADLYAHLATCAECRRELTALERTVALVRGTAPVRAPAGFADRVLAAARPPWYVRAARAALLPWPVKLPLEAAAVLLVAGLAILLFRGLAEEQRATRYASPPPVLADRAPAPARPASEAEPRQESESKLAAPAPTVPAPAARELQSNRADAPAANDAAGVATRGEQAPAAQPPIAERDGAAPRVARDQAAKVERQLAPQTLAQAPARFDVVARLSTADADGAARDLAALAARLGGAETGRRATEGVLIVDLAVPGRGYPEFAREAARLGDYRTESQPSALPDTVRVTVRIAR